MRGLVARGVVGGDGDFDVGFFKNGGGGIAFRSRSSFVTRVISIDSAVFTVCASFAAVIPSWIPTGALLFPTAWSEGRRSHSKKDQEDGGCL